MRYADVVMTRLVGQGYGGWNVHRQAMPVESTGRRCDPAHDR
ncbi:MAG: hypothetical protein R2932_46285 [Caldilineaceae bacterium]